MTGYTWNLNQGTDTSAITTAYSSKWGTSSLMVGNNVSSIPTTGWAGLINPGAPATGNMLQSDTWTLEWWMNFGGQSPTGTTGSFFTGLIGNFSSFRNVNGDNSAIGANGQFGSDWQFRFSSNTSSWYWCIGQNQYLLASYPSSYAASTWYYFTICQSKGTLYFFINGSLLSTTTMSDNPIPDFTSVGIGQTLLSSSNSWAFKQVLINEFLLTLGVCKYTSTFTPPTAAYNSGTDAYHANVYIYSSFDGGTNGATSYVDQSFNVPWTLTANPTTSTKIATPSKTIARKSFEVLDGVQLKKISPATMSDRDGTPSEKLTNKTTQISQTHLPSIAPWMPNDPTPTWSFDTALVETNDFIYYYYDPNPYIPTVSNRGPQYQWQYEYAGQKLPLQFQQEPYFIAGNVSLNSVPMQGAIIKIEGAEGEEGSFFGNTPIVSDVNGNFVFHNMPNLVYSLRCTPPESYGLSDLIWANVTPVPYAFSITGTMSTNTSTSSVVSTVEIVNGYGPFTIELASGSLPPGTTLAVVGTNVQVQGTTTFFNSSYFFAGTITDALGNSQTYNFQVNPPGTNSLGLIGFQEGTHMGFWKEALSTWIDFEMPTYVLTTTANQGDFSNFNYWVFDKGNDLGVYNGPNATYGSGASPWLTYNGNGLLSNNSGGAYRSSTQAKFGTYSGYIAGTTSTGYAFYKGANTNFQGNFTIDMFIYITAYPTSSSFYGWLASNDDTSGNRGWRVSVNYQGQLALSVRGVNGTDYTVSSGSTVVPLNAWTHVAAVRNGQDLYVFIGGNIFAARAVIPAGLSMNFVPAMNQMPFGTCINARTNVSDLTYYMDDVVVCNGGAMYTTNFTPRTQPFNPLISRY